MTECPDPMETRDVLWTTWQFLTSIPFDSRNNEWESLAERVKILLNNWNISPENANINPLPLNK